MTEKDKIQDLFTPSGCLSKHGLIRYIEGMLTPTEQKQADMHVNGCELCSDAISGYNHHQSPGAVLPEVNNLNRRLHLRFLSIPKRKRKEPQSMVSIFSVAATIILIAGLFLLLKQREINIGKTLAESRHDSVIIPDQKPVQSNPRPESETSRKPLRKTSDEREEKRKEVVFSDAPVQDIKEVEPIKENAEIVEIIIASEDEEIRSSEENNIPEILTDSVTIGYKKAETAPRPYRKVEYAPAGTKKKAAHPEKESAGQVGMKASQAPQDEIYLRVEEMPMFMEGDISRFLKYIQENLVYPSEAAITGIEGKVLISFVINELGKLTDARVVRPLDPLLDSVALRVVTLSPLWNAGKQAGNPVKVSYTVPIVFSIQGN